MSENNKSKPSQSRGHGPNLGYVEKPKNFKKTISKLLNYLKPYRISILIVIIFAAGSSVFGIMGPKILGEGITLLFANIMEKRSAGIGSIDFEGLIKILTKLGILYILSSAFMLIQGLIITKVAQEVSYDFRKIISEKINRLPLSYFDKFTHGEVMSRVTNDVDTISQTLNQSLSQVITSVTTVIGVLFMMFSISPSLTLVGLLTVPLSLIIVMVVVKLSQKYFVQQQEYLGHVNGQVEEIFSGHVVVKAFNNEEKAYETFEGYNDQLFNSAWKSQFLSGVLMPAMGFVGNLGYVAVSVFGGVLVIRKALEVGEITSFVQYIRSFNQPITQIAQISNLLQSTAAASERVFEFLESEEEIEETKNPVSCENVKGGVEFINIHFGYNKEQEVIKNFSASIKEGQKVAIVGPTGAGKTTIVKLLMRFYELNEGEILIDGININNFSRTDLREQFSMVLQDAWLFSDTIMENIRYGNLNASNEDVIKAAKAANVHHFIKTLPGGYDMELNEEVSNISQGQRQLLTIARAILSDPKILILDEATSSVDTRTELLIQRGMANLMKGRTSFIIAHRLSTIKDADLIFVMNEGDIVEQGTHEELLAKKGFYYELYNSQFESGESA